MSRGHDIRALCKGARFARLCQQERSARVLSVHDKVINLQAGDEVLALALPQAGGSSWFLSLNTLPDVDCGDELRFSPTAITIQEIAIDLQGVPLWKGPLPVQTRALLSSERSAAFTSAWENLSLQLPEQLPDVLTPQNVMQWIGLGPGLTPAGDDVVLGYLAVDNHLGYDIAWTQSLHATVRRALSRTTTLSAQLLKNALECDYHESIQRPLAVLCGESSENLLSVLRLLAQIGASSGESVIYGMWLALQRISNREKAELSLFKAQPQGDGDPAPLSYLGAAFIRSDGLI